MSKDRPRKRPRSGARRKRRGFLMSDVSRIAGIVPDAKASALFREVAEDCFKPGNKESESNGSKKEVPHVIEIIDHDCEGIYICRVDNCPVCGFSHIEAMFHYVKWWMTSGPEQGPEKWKDVGLMKTTPESGDIAISHFKGGDPNYFRHVQHGPEWDAYMAWQFELYAPDKHNAQDMIGLEEELC